MDKKSVTPEDAATVILARETPGGLEVYLTRRQDYLAFLGGYYVFPGGKVDAEDAAPDLAAYCNGFGPEEARGCLEGVAEPGRAFGFYMAAIRELFEEAGVLLADARDGDSFSDPAFDRRLAGHRKRLQEDRIKFHEVVESEKLCLQPADLLWFAHWITPATSPRRFSTFFFAARLPEGQVPNPFAEEIAEALWVRPADALARWRNGHMPMIPPTVSSLDTIARYRNWKELACDFSRPPCHYPRTVFT